MWLLGAKRVLLDSDALDTEMNTPKDMLAELSRPDAAIFLNPSRTNKDGMKVDDNLTLADAQYKVLMDAKQASQEVVGVFNAMLGRESSTTANSALVTLVDQGTTALAEINDNYRFARRLVGERLLDLVRDDIMGQRVEIAAGEPNRKRLITLNNPLTVPNPESPEQMVQIVQNSVRDAKVKVALDDVLSSAAYREQQFTMLAELTKGLPPNLQGIIAPFIMEASDLQKRREIADTLRKAMGQPIPKTPEEERQAEAQQQQAMAFAAQIQQRTALAEIAEREAKVMKLRAEAEKAMAEAKSDPNLAKHMQTEFDTRVAAVEAAAKTQIDRVTAQLMTVRMNAGTREQRLLAQLSAAANALKVNASNAEALRLKAESEREIAKINAEKDKEVARIQAESSAIVDGMTAEIAKVRAEMTKRIEDEAAKLEADRLKAEKQRLDDEKKRLAAEEKERKERERERKEEQRERERKDAERDKERKEAEKAKGEVEVTVVKVGPGQFKATKKRKDK
jgi:hypothetical protein